MESRRLPSLLCRGFQNPQRVRRGPSPADQDVGDIAGLETCASRAGEIVGDSPTWNETLVCPGIWALGLLIYTILRRVAVPILQGRFTRTPVVSPGRTMTVQQGPSRDESRRRNGHRTAEPQPTKRGNTGAGSLVIPCAIASLVRAVRPGRSRAGVRVGQASWPAGSRGNIAALFQARHVGLAPPERAVGIPPEPAGWQPDPHNPRARSAMPTSVPWSRCRGRRGPV